MVQVETDTFITATRKPHTCPWCGEGVGLGHNAMKRDYRYEDNWHHEWMHPDCFRAMQEVHRTERTDDGFEYGEFKRGSTTRRDE